MKKALSLILAVAMLCLAGCTGNDNASTTAATTTDASGSTTATTAPSQSEPVEFSYVSWNCGSIEEDNWAETKLEEKLNVKIETAKVDLSQSQQLDLMLASGEMPDCGWILRGTSEMWDQGIIRTIPKSMIETYAPQYTALLNAEPIGWQMNLSDTPDEYLALTGYQAGNVDSAAFASCYRLDWLENVGITPNGELVQLDDEGRLFLATEPFTQSQFLDIMDKFTNGDPDGNGQNDTYGMTASMDHFIEWGGLRGMFGFSDTGAYVENGVANNYYATDMYKDYLKFAASLYANGYLDPEFAVLDFQQANEKMATGKAGFMGVHFEWASQLASYQTRAPMNIINQNPDAKVVIMPTETQDDGTGGARPYSLSNFNYTFYVNKDVDDEKLATILKFFDYANFDDEAKIYLRYGEEGTHFEYTDPENNVGPALKEGVTNGGSTGLWVYNANYVADLEVKSLSWDKAQQIVQEYCLNDFQKYLKYPDKLDQFNETELSDLNVKYGSSITTLVQEYFYDVVGGEKDVDATWDEYIQTIESAGYDKIREELQKCPDFVNPLN